MDCLDVLGAVVSPSPSHAFGLDVCDLKHKVAIAATLCFKFLLSFIIWG